MNQESQNIEWKESWRDEYLKWICGFANAQGGKIYIGKTDKGEIIDLKDAKKLLEDIPNKVRDILGILVNVNLLTEKDRQYLEIEIEAYPAPISALSPIQLGKCRNQDFQDFRIFGRHFREAFSLKILKILKS